MQIFKSALKIFFSHKIYISVYVFALAFMGVAIAMGSAGEPRESFSENKPNIAVIDRDGSDLSRGLEAYLADRATIIEVDDTKVDLQDAVAQNQVAFIAIIPEGFGSDFVEACTSGRNMPEIETVTSYVSVSGALMNNVVNGYLDTVRVYLATETATNQQQAVDFAEEDLATGTEASLVSLGDETPISQQYTLYMQFSSYTVMISVIVCAAVVMSTFRKTEIRKRTLASPYTSSSANLQMLAACFVIALIAWVWVMALGLIAFGGSLVGLNPAIIGLFALDLLAYCIVGLMIGFLLGQLTTSEGVINAAGNIFALVCSFLGGVWIPLAFTNDAIRTIAQFVPTYYYGEAINEIISMRSFSLNAMQPVFANIGILLLFAVAFFVVALVLGRIRVQTAEAGGNAAAERPRG